MKLKHRKNYQGIYHAYPRRVTIHTYFNLLGERYLKTVNAKRVARYFKWDGKSWQLIQWVDGSHIERIIRSGYGKRAKRQPR